jgi:hypothetical protein
MGASTMSTYNYPSAGSANPHAVQKVTNVTGFATTTSNYGYDAGKNDDETDQTLAYNQVGKLDTVTAGTSSQSNVYDANGPPSQNDPTNGATLFLGDTQLHQAAGPR